MTKLEPMDLSRKTDGVFFPTDKITHSWKSLNPWTCHGKLNQRSFVNNGSLEKSATTIIPAEKNKLTFKQLRIYSLASAGVSNLQVIQKYITESWQCSKFTPRYSWCQHLALLSPLTYLQVDTITLLKHSHHFSNISISAQCSTSVQKQTKSSFSTVIHQPLHASCTKLTNGQIDVYRHNSDTYQIFTHQLDILIIWLDTQTLISILKVSVFGQNKLDHGRTLAQDVSPSYKCQNIVHKGALTKGRQIQIKAIAKTLKTTFQQFHCNKH